MVRALTLVPFRAHGRGGHGVNQTCWDPTAGSAPRPGGSGSMRATGFFRDRGVAGRARVLHVAVVVRVVGRIGPGGSSWRTAESLGAGRIETFWQILLPVARPATRAPRRCVPVRVHASRHRRCWDARAVRRLRSRSAAPRNCSSSGGRVGAGAMVFVGVLLLVESVWRHAPRYAVTGHVGCARRRDRRERLLRPGGGHPCAGHAVLALAWRAFGGLGGLLRAFTSLGDARRGACCRSRR